MAQNPKDSCLSPSPKKGLLKEPSTPRARSNSYLSASTASPLLRGRLLSPVIDEFSLRRTPSRGATTSPAPAKGVRKRLHQHRNFGHAVELLQSSRNIVVLTGAGISTSVGIPDFRSDKGLYAQLSKDLGITQAEDFFSKEYFISDTERFFHYVKRVIPEAVLGTDGYYRPTNPETPSKNGKATVPEFSLTHAFLALLHKQRKLLTNYTQNIDGLEIAAGIPRSQFVQCHGSWESASCLTCGRSSAARKYLPVVFSGNIPYCRCKLEAEEKAKKKSSKRKKRSWDEFDSDHSSDDGTQAPRGLLKPDITFFGEHVSGAFKERLRDDKRKIDLLIIIGTSLKVGPVQDMLYQISPQVPQIFISKERFNGALCSLPGVQVDIELLGECDVIIDELCRRAGWSNELESLLWEENQMTIKETHDKVLIQQAGSSSNDQDVDTKFDHAPAITTSPQKKIKTGSQSMLSREMKSSDSEVDTTNAQALINFRNSVPTIITPDASQTPGSQGPVLATNTKPGQTQANTLHASTSSSDLEPSLVLKKQSSRVKIELMEGTSHQWRITRR